MKIYYEVRDKLGICIERGEKRRCLRIRRERPGTTLVRITRRTQREVMMQHERIAAEALQNRELRAV